MKITKYEHACFTVEKEGKLLVIDPGAFTTDLPVLENVVAVVVTHEHADHFNSASLDAIIAHSPDAVVLAHGNITKQLGDTLPAQTVATGESITVGPFSLEFFGGAHATIHESLQPVANLGVLINKVIYYPGDSFSLPNQPVTWLALPVWAPWLKLSEAIDFARSVNPTHIFPTHDSIASDIGKQLTDRLVPDLTGISYQRLLSPVEVED